MKVSKKLHNVVSAVMCLALILGLFVGTSLPTQAAFNGDYKGFSLDYHDSGAFDKADGWTNGGMFGNCTWRANNVSFNGGIMNLTINSDWSTPYSGAEYRTRDFYGYGVYDVRMKPIKCSGVVSSFFTYTGPTDGNPWDEIDIEFLGKDTTKVQFNYYTNGVGNHEYVHNLGFDASQSFHNYGFKWEPGRITWYVDGKQVHTATSNIPTTPGKIMMNVWPGTGVDEWLGHYWGNTPLTAQYDWASYTSIAKSNADWGGSSNNNNNNNNNNSNNNNNNNTSSSGIVSGGTYYLTSKLNNKTIDIAYWGSNNGDNIQQWDYLGQANQKWKLESTGDGYYVIRSTHSNKVLDVEAKSTSNGGNVCQWEYNWGWNQQWKIEKVGDAYRIINRHSGKALDIEAKANWNGANICQWDYNGGANQLWYFHKL